MRSGIGAAGWGIALFALTMMSGSAGAQQGQLIYVPSSGTGTFSSIDTADDALVADYVAGPVTNFAASAVSPDQSIAYLLSNDSPASSVVVVDTATNAVITTIATGNGSQKVVISPDGSRLYVSNYGDFTISVIDTATNAVVATVPTGGVSPLELAISADGGFVYVSHISSSEITKIDTATNSVAATFTLGIRNLGIYASADGAKLYVADFTGPFLNVLDATTGAVLNKIFVGNLGTLTASPDGTRLYVANVNFGTVSVVDLGSDTVVATIAVGSIPQGLFVSADGSKLYVANRSSDTVQVFSIDPATDSYTLIETIARTSPRYISACSNGNALLTTGKVFTANSSGALHCTTVTATGTAPGPIFNGGAMLVNGSSIVSALPVYLDTGGGAIDTPGANSATFSGVISGPGGLTKLGTGSLILEGINNYSGPTSVQVGLLRAGVAGAFSQMSAFTIAAGAMLDLGGFDQEIGSLAGSGSVTNSGAVAAMLVTGGDDTSTTFSGVISDGARTLALTKLGAGSLILEGANTYTGGTVLTGGVLSVSSDANLGTASGGLTFNSGTLAATASFDSARAITLDATGRFDVAAGASLGLSGPITGLGDLVKLGAGTLVLPGSNSYGDTQVEAGTLIGNVDAISGDIGNAETVVFEQGADASFVGTIGGLGGANGEMIKRGAGELTLIGTSSLDWTIEAGGLMTAADRFGGNAAIASGAGLTFDQVSGATYAGVLSGAGGFTVSGTGITALTGDSSAFGGNTLVSGGTLIVGTAAGGALGGSMTIGNGGLLGGTGAIGAAGSTVTITAGGVHAPGISIGVQHIAGDYVNHGTLRIEATPIEADRIVVVGSVDITGATLDLVLSPTDAASWNVFNGPYTIIEKQSTGAVVGTFVDPVTQNLLFLDALVAYDGGDDGNDVTLELVRNDLPFANVGQTPNQVATGTAVDTLDHTHAVWHSIALTNDQDVVRASFDALSGEVHASVRAALIEDSRFVRNAIDDRIRAAFDGTGASYPPVLAYDLGDTPVLVSPDYAGTVFWTNGFGSWGSTDSDGNAVSLDRSTGGLLIGADTFIGDWRIGLLAGYSHSSFKVNDRSSTVSSDNYHLGLYGGTEWGALAFRTGAAYTWHDIDTARAIAIPGIAESLTAGYNAGTFQAFGELAYGFSMGTTRFEPFANLAHVHLHTDGFTEMGGIAALRGVGGNTDVTFTTLGLRAEHGVTLGTVEATFSGMLGWRHAFGDTTPTSTHAFPAGDAFSIAGAPIARNAAVIAAGLDLNLTPGATLGVSYTGQLSGSVQDHDFTANLSIRF